MQLRSPIFILGCHKSGTSLVRSLLDSHPEIDFVYPNELHFFRIAGCEMHYPLGPRFPAPADFTELARNALRQIEPAAKGKKAFARFGPHSSLNSFSSELFLEAMAAEPVPTSSRDQFLRYLEAVAVSLRYNLDQQRHPIRIVEKSVSNVEFAGSLKRFFPDCHFVHVVRNPYANIVGIRRAKRGSDSVGSLRALVGAIGLSFRHALKNRDSLPDYHILRYEDLLQDPERLTRDLCSRLRIGWSGSMLVSTVLGQPWGGNSSSRADFGSAISQRPLHEWKGHIKSIEISLINRHFPDVMSILGYEKVRPRRHWLLPELNERPSAYLSNRLYLRFGSEHIP